MLINLRNALMAGGGKKPYWGLTFTAEQANSTISMTKGADAPTLNLVTSVNNGKTWETFTPGETTITLAKVGDSVWFAAGESGNACTASSAVASGVNCFSMAGRVSANGSVMSLLNASEPTYSCGSQYTFSSLFYGCTSLTTAPSLPAETLASYCYHCMFYGCTALTTAPALPATTLASYCYYCMFRGCTSLTTAPSLPAETLASYCYFAMFMTCTSLTAAPALPAASLTVWCYASMFSDCTSLTSAPALPATTLATANCYQYMFSGCTSLTSAPALPATTLASNCYSYMFQGCTALTTAPALPATRLAGSCYRYMFDGCTALTTPPPTLPATELTGTTGAYTYQYMFRGCSNLEKAPVICLTTTPGGTQPMRYMFRNCSKLKEIEIHISSWPTTTATMGGWVQGVSATGTFKCPTALGTDSTITRGTGNCPTGWTVVNI